MESLNRIKDLQAQINRLNDEIAGERINIANKIQELLLGESIVLWRKITFDVIKYENIINFYCANKSRVAKTIISVFGEEYTLVVGLPEDVVFTDEIRNKLQFLTIKALTL